MAYFLCVELGPSATYHTSRHRRNGNNMNDEEILAEFRAAQALLEGHFILSSGKRSANYLQCARVLMDPERAGRVAVVGGRRRTLPTGPGQRSEEHTSELQSLMRNSYAVFCLKKKTKHEIKRTKSTKDCK